MVVVGLREVGGFPALIDQLNAIDPAILDPFQISFIGVAVGWFFFGVAVLGQPQLMVRHMVARSDKDLRQARTIYFIWRWTVLFLSILSGLIARILIPAGESFDPELSIPALWEDLLPPVLVGFLVAGLFSATMSTADSLLLSASSALTQHVVPKMKNCYVKARLGTISVILLIVAIALLASKGVLSLVILAWAGLGSAVAPLIIVQLLGARPSYKTAIAMMIGGFAVTTIWRYGLGWHVHVMDLVPGMLSGFVIFFTGQLIGNINNNTKRI